MELEVGKTYLTRRGLKAKCVIDNISGERPCVCVVTKEDGTEYASSHTINGFQSPMGFLTEDDIVSEYKDPEYIPLSWETRDVIREKGGWVINKKFNHREDMIRGIDATGVAINSLGRTFLKWECLLDEYEFLDGTPCGILK